MVLRLQRQRAAGDEARNARHRMQGEDQQVAAQDLQDVRAVAHRERWLEGEDLLIAAVERGDEPHGDEQARSAASAEPATQRADDREGRPLPRVQRRARVPHAVRERVGRSIHRQCIGPVGAVT